MKKTITHDELVSNLHSLDYFISRELLDKLVNYLEMYEIKSQIDLEINEDDIRSSYVYYADKEDLISVNPDNEIIFEYEGRLLVFYTDYFINQ